MMHGVLQYDGNMSATPTLPTHYEMPDAAIVYTAIEPPLPSALFYA